MIRRARAIAVAALCIAVLAGCAPAAASGRGSGDVSGGGFHLAQIGSDRFSKDRTIRVDRVDAPPTNGYEWTVGVVDPSSRALRLSYTDGACTSADRVAVQETASAVVIGISTSQSFSGNCIAVGIPRAATVELRRPLGGRALMEGATGVNDGLSKVDDAATLPDPTCTTDDVADAPAGTADVAKRIAPAGATSAFLCRTWWPKGRARAESTTVSDRVQVAALVAALNAGTRSAHVGPVPVLRCPKHLDGSWYAIYLEGPGLQVEVKADEIGCSTITNGALSGTMSSALMRRLDALFSS